MNGRRGGGEGRRGSGGCEGWPWLASVSACVFWFSLYFSDLLRSVVTLFVFGKAAPDDLPHAPQRQALRVGAHELKVRGVSPTPTTPDGEVAPVPVARHAAL